MSNIHEDNNHKSEIELDQKTSVSKNWKPPPFIKNTILRWALLIIFVLYLFLAIGSIKRTTTKSQ